MLENIATMPISELPLRDSVQVPSTATLGAVVDAMHAKRHGAAMVVERGELIGIFSERDLIHRVDHADPAWQDLPVAEVMTAMPMIIREDDTVAEALRRMNVGKRRHLPIIRDRSTAVGMISIRDILSYLASRFPAHFINLPPDPEHEAHAPWGG
ncbi:MAG: CBS domain-containing protein [Kofleriaceae bacterium]|nr:CBS domain-containing protein [Myxococcales bacterium]MCB9560966.1 CBS domain-containing protein [Kofleriaceae bacterium]MCB9575006.1 CBS domain-containing protein [Kofleriaceae bacterium]